MKYLSLFKDKKDYEKVITDDSVINVLGTKGSGKTTSSLGYINDSNYIVINCDRLLDLPSNDKEDKELKVIRNMLIDKYGEIYSGDKFSICYKDIIKYVLDKKKKLLIEGNIIMDMSYQELVGKVIIKRTAIIKCFIRAVKRDYGNKYFMELEKKEHKYLYKITRFLKITKRRFSVFKDAKEVNKLIEMLEK